MICRIARAGHRAGCMLALALALSPSTSSAQQPAPGQLPTDLPQRPTGAVFAGYRQPQRDVLGLTTEAYGGYDQELQGPPGGSGFGSVRTGAFAGLDAALNYSPTQSTNFDFNARGFTSLRLYTNPSEFIPANSNGDVSASFRLSRRATFQARGGFMYTPYFDFPIVEELPLPGVIAPVPIRQRVTGASPRRVGTYDGGADLSYGLTDSVGVGASYGIRRTDVSRKSCWSRRSCSTTGSTPSIPLHLAAWTCGSTVARHHASRSCIVRANTMPASSCGRCASTIFSSPSTETGHAHPHAGRPCRS